MAISTTSDSLYTGFVALRSKQHSYPMHLFDDRCIKISDYTHIILRMKGDYRHYSFNFATARSLSGDLYSCDFKLRTPYEWEDVIVIHYIQLVKILDTIILFY